MALATSPGCIPGLNGPHDIGGMGNIGPIPIEGDDEPVFHEPWEGRVLAMTLSGVVSGTFTVDHCKAAPEELHPIAFMSMTYFEQWLYTLEVVLEDAGAVTREEVEARLATYVADPDAPLPKGNNEELTEQINALIFDGVPQAQVDRAPRFGPGDEIVTTVIHVSPRAEHTSMPGYVQGKPGVVEIVHRPEPLGDAVVAGEGMKPEYVYAVAFRAADLWPDGAAADTVVVDLFESYLEPANG